ncbi:hypothetical protein AVEN_120200-1 [Araneus ventricosus]|uniref:Endonuclease/exonuclease/phosphatase domain-containing protein n=1 Tax=Araneus ventricosus TaxID=182803 RepID=A0A4Y2UKI9_ARAVE|nr:hypothetical protein AVEN_120200-1 [Araneus ventricosus]
MDLVNLRGIQINTNHCQTAHVSALQAASDLNLDVITVQDPYIIAGRPMEPAPGYKMYSSKNDKAIVIICNKNIKPYIKLQTEHIIIVELHIGNKILNISSVYFPPHDNIDNLINEFLNYDFNRGINLVTEDFNCRSRLWGYQIEDDRGRSMTDFISLNNLHICNIPELGPSSISTTFGKGNPDLTSISSSFQDGIEQWGILGRLSLTSLEEYFVDLLESVCGAAFKSFKKKPEGKKRGYTFWCDDLRNFRNSTNVLYKKYQGFKRNNSPEDVIQEAGAENRRSRAQYKRLLLRTKRKAWEDYCGNYTEKLGGIFGMVFNKSNKVNNILVNPDND